MKTTNKFEIDKNDLTIASKQLWSKLEPYIYYLNNKEKEVVQLAFLQMVEAHSQQRRKSGEFYIIHPVEATITLAQIQLDVDTLAACLMHDVPEDTEVSLKDLEKIFSKEVVFLVFGITKLGKIKYQGIDRYAENLRKMFVAMSKDLRVVFIKLADRLHNLRTLKSLAPEKAYRIALESLEIYAPIAERLGMNYFKGEIEDAAFPFVYPEKYKQFIQLSDVEIQKRQKNAKKLMKKMQILLDKEGVKNYTLKGRAKKYYSLFKKMETHDNTLDKIFDLVALRIVVDSVDDCYTIFSMIHKVFEPVKGTMKDYINKPKPNGYQSLHISVRDTQTGQPFEIQVRTHDMDEFAEYGVAAHWAYKAKGAKVVDIFLDMENLKWIKDLVSLGKEELDHEDYLNHVKLDLFKDRIFVMTPKGDVIDLPEGATPLDFAYKIHEEIGSHAFMAKVNDNPIKLSDSLKNGDVVTILTDRKQQPKLDWLKWVKTGQASKQIRAKLRKLK
ncbi:MAG: bifunctional (p)ppGpp synthetase/guanosine-3',5'-bis(diphosphate) 3'-pyrophosphohydrolase [candidate division SR1 bacterium]|nr:bifunctional (p)ppGpp synthetase/guanosine-3',5'-bis(diphosphate) 3'-pyrophosphohydrolase [candidate division SR1 bacterium]